MCTDCRSSFPFRYDGGMCDCGGALLVQYDLEHLKKESSRDVWRKRPSTLWRYHELLPVSDTNAIVSLGEGWTPLIRMSRWEKKLGLGRLWVKREDQNPTGSFKARGFSVALSLVRETPASKVAVNSNGNAASALAAYAARAGLQAFVFVPRDCPGMIVEESVAYGAHAYLVDGLIHHAGQVVEDGKGEMGWRDLGTAKEPGRVEGKKTMGLELAEQLGWKMPDVVVYPTGGGSGLIGIWKALLELKQLGWAEGDLPRFVAVQETGCTPVVDAVRTKADRLTPAGDNTTSKPTGVRVPNPPAGNLILSIIRETGGTAVAVTAEEMEKAAGQMGREGISASPEGSAVWAGLLRLHEQGEIRAGEQVALFNTAHSLKYLPWPTPKGVPIIRSYADYRSLI